MSGKGWLKNGNPPGDFRKAPRCGAKNRRGLACQQPGMTNGRCRRLMRLFIEQLAGGESGRSRTPFRGDPERCSDLIPNAIPD